MSAAIDALLDVGAVSSLVCDLFAGVQGLAERKGECVSMSTEKEIDFGVLLRDSRDGAEKWVDRYPREWWETGNGSCDCNRQLFLHGHDPKTFTGTCLGTKHIRIVAIRGRDALVGLNDGYPEEG